MTDKLTALEEKALSLTAAQNWPGQSWDGVLVVDRVNTGAGRRTSVLDSTQRDLLDGRFSNDDHYIEMMGLPFGLTFVVYVENRRVSMIELVTNGAVGWDGVERDWYVV